MTFLSSKKTDDNPQRNKESVDGEPKAGMLMCLRHPLQKFLDWCIRQNPVLYVRQRKQK